MARADESDLRQGGKGDNLTRGFDRGPSDFDDQPNQIGYDQPDTEIPSVALRLAGAQINMFGSGADNAVRASPRPNTAGGSSTVYEQVAEQLDQAHRSLTLQHDGVLQLLAQKPKSKAEGPSTALAAENRALKKQISQLQSVDMQNLMLDFGEKLNTIVSSISMVQTDLALVKGEQQKGWQPSPPQKGADVPKPDGGAPEMKEEKEDKIVGFCAADEESSSSSSEAERRPSRRPNTKNGRKSRKTRENSRGRKSSHGNKKSARLTASSTQMQAGFTVLEMWEKDKDDVAFGTRLPSQGGLSNMDAYDDEMDKATAQLYDRKSTDDEEDFVESMNKSPGFCAKLMLNPNCKKRTFWDLASMVLVLNDMVMIPFGFFDPEETTGLIVLSWITRLFWSSDMPMSFLSGYIAADGCIEMRPTRVAKRYMKSWFALDCLVVGVDWMEFIMSSASDALGMARLGKASRIFRILRLLRLLRLAKVGEIVQLMAEKLPSEKLVIFIDILKLIVIMLGIGHLLACLWFAIGKAGPANKNWLKEYDFIDETIEYQYIMSLRWALSQFAGGMDEVTPISLAEHCFGAVVFISCFWSGTVFLSILTSHMTQLYILGNQQSQQLNTMRRYLSQNGISKGLALRVTRNAQHAMKMRQRTTPEAAVGLVDLVSEPLRIELHFEMYFPVLGHHPFFAEYYKAAPHVIRKICHAAMSICSNSTGDIIFHFGEQSDKMRMLKQGELKYTWLSKNLARDQLIEVGDWISEGPLWTQWVHRGVLTAVEDSITFILDAATFHKIVLDFKLLSFDPADYAYDFVQQLNDMEDEVSDLPLRNYHQSKHHFGLHRGVNLAQGLRDKGAGTLQKSPFTKAWDNQGSRSSARASEASSPNAIQDTEVSKVPALPGPENTPTADTKPVLDEVTDDEINKEIAKVQAAKYANGDTRSIQNSIVNGPSGHLKVTQSPSQNQPHQIKVSWPEENGAAEPRTTRPMTPDRKFHQGPKNGIARPVSQGSTRPPSQGSARPPSQGSQFSNANSAYMNRPNYPVEQFNQQMDPFGYATTQNSLSATAVRPYAAPAGNIRMPAHKVCKMCGKRFKEQDGLDAHMREVHHCEPGQAPRVPGVHAGMPSMPGQNRSQWSEFDEEV
jgi:hypothetical protein